MSISKLIERKRKEAQTIKTRRPYVSSHTPRPFSGQTCCVEQRKTSPYPGAHLGARSRLLVREVVWAAAAAPGDLWSAFIRRGYECCSSMEI